MHILICNHAPVPVFAYGGTERVIWDLAKGLINQGHQVSFLVPENSQCSFARVLPLNPRKSLKDQIPEDVDLVHFHFNPGPSFECSKPWLMTQHGNSIPDEFLPINTVFVSSDHARRHGSQCFVHNGLDWNAYGPANLHTERQHYHFLGKAAWRVKNVQGAIDVSKHANVPLVVMGGTRLNLKRGFRFTWSRHIKFLGMVGGDAKFSTLQQSKGLIFPVRWHEPFGLAVIESLYFGCPIFCTPYGALPEIVSPECGFISHCLSELSEAIQSMEFNKESCHQRAVDLFNSERMTHRYLEIYERIMSCEVINSAPPMMKETAARLPWKT
jgi:glycosyltransferase involved in cell wall biosynthesis